MRILLAPAGSRGDFQPLLALAVGLRAAGHAATIASGECFREECEAFGVPFVRAGLDVREFLQQQGRRGSFTPLRASAELIRAGRNEAPGFIRDLVAPCRDADVVIGGGAQIAAPTAAEAAGKPYWFVAYTPQVLPSAYHPPFTLPVMGLPRIGNRLLWALSGSVISLAFGGRIQATRRALGLPPYPDLGDHVFPRGRCLLACDPELTPPPPDLGLFCPPIGSLHLDDSRPLPEDLEAFLRDGPPPVYLGFGSMPDPAPAATSRLLLEAVKLVGCRAILSSGWAGLGVVGHVPAQVKVVGATSHRVLFPRVAAVVHHGGAGTTAASARAGRPQLVVHHAFDQIGIGREVQRAEVGPAPLARSGLTARSLADGLRQLLQRMDLSANAAALGQAIRRRDPVKAVVELLEQLAARPG